MGTTTITRNFQVTLPSDVREETGLEIGERMIVKVSGPDEIVLKKVKRSPVDRAFGIIKTKETGLEYERRIREEWKGR